VAPDRVPGHRRAAPRWVPERLADSTAVNRVIVVAAVLAVLIFAAWGISRGAIGLIGKPDSSTKAAPSASATRSASPSASPSASRKALAAAGSNVPAKEGSLQFVAAKVHGQAGKELVTVTVKNLSSAWSTFYGESQFLLGDGQQKSRGVPSLLYLEPKETATTTLTFPVPKNFKATKLELHAEPSSAGVDLALSGR
jgi:FtsP/CotA-like multicopper oxidase with cupredoxin domain